MTLCAVPQTACRALVEDRLLARLYGEPFRRHAEHSWGPVPGIGQLGSR